MLQSYVLRQWQSGDEESLTKNANNYNIWRNLKDIFPHPYTIEEAYGWVKIAQNSPETFAFESDYFYDTVYHLNGKGREKRTRIFLEELKDFIKP